jgi:alpha-tubulin suppressor-like RCC1 family protein
MNSEHACARAGLGCRGIGPLAFSALILSAASFCCHADTVNAHFSASSDNPVVSSGYTAGGNEVNLSLGFAPPAGTDLLVVKNTGLPFISGVFSNLAHGQEIGLQHDGVVYRFVANYFGGSGNDLTLMGLRRGAASWGGNFRGQLGDNHTSDRNVPGDVDAGGLLAGKTVMAMEAGGQFSLLLASDGSVYSWGRNLSGELGIGTAVTSTRFPMKVISSGVLSGRTVVAVSAGDAHALALCSDGTVASWGSNSSGQLGDNSTTNRSSPVLVDTSVVLSGRTVVAVSAGISHSVALCADGTLVSWGQNFAGQLGNGGSADSSMPVVVDASGVLADKVVIAVSAGAGYSLALCSDGMVAAWGGNSAGCLGDGTTTNSATPVMVNMAGVLAGQTAVAVSASDHSLALCASGLVAAWGPNTYGQLGNNSQATSNVPVAVDASGALNGKTVLAISAGIQFSLASCSDGTAVAWGLGSSGQLGNNSLTPSLVPVLVNADGDFAGKSSTMISAGGMHSLMAAALPPGSQLAGLALTGGNLINGFSPDIVSYRARVTGTTSVVSIIPTAMDASVVKVDGVPVVSGMPCEVPVFHGRVVAIQVIGQGGATADYDLTLLVNGVIDLQWSDASTVSMAGNGCEFGGSTLNLSLEFAPAPGRGWTVLENTGQQNISRNFLNLVQGQTVVLSYQGIDFRFSANYHGGSGNDLVLEWAQRSVAAWGSGSSGQLGPDLASSTLQPLKVKDPLGVMTGRTVVSVAAGAAHSLALCTDGTVVTWGTGQATSSMMPHVISNSGYLAGK